MSATPYTREQIAVWLRGLLTIAWADGNFDTQEQELINSITKDQLAPCVNFQSLETITPEELAAMLGESTPAAENFLRTAVMVAIADGIYSPSEEKILKQFCRALKLDPHILNSLQHTLENLENRELEDEVPENKINSLDLLHPLREWLDRLEIHDHRLARFLCNMIPSQCPFERDVTLFGKKIVHIPPMCKINPLYEQLVGLRFRALSYLADDCQEDISKYI
ncbi:Mo-dependent nitrogenase C-terminal domain-containing protein [Cylindrospermopsis curvispora]|uniref:Nitrogenase n=1 Tax=Cylindrospermopsis curvispora GIHE-G1 TaxID=2666332 RepID=A0A7H0F2P8_9CYAN|nr:Mo-dependent nitrogenase C-terminal domain-containing protein [Cylindrospermopsis curvispora]QNP30314.1 nitrogenase [Cylindrospermopsis curvispora GIHE-G1]